MELNERAAKVMGSEIDASGSIRKPDGYWARNWNPREDYNHARMLYQRVVEKGLKTELFKLLWKMPGVKDSATYDHALLAILDLTAEQLTLACCTVLEAHDA